MRGQEAPTSLIHLVLAPRRTSPAGSAAARERRREFQDRNHLCHLYLTADMTISVLGDI